MKPPCEILSIGANSAITIRTSSAPVPFTATYTFDGSGDTSRLAIAAAVEAAGLSDWLPDDPSSTGQAVDQQLRQREGQARILKSGAHDGTYVPRHRAA